MTDQPEEQEGPDFSTVLASSVHDMKNSLGMLLNSLDEIVAAVVPANDEQARQFATLQYEASRINGELIKLLAIYRMQKNRLPLHVDEHFVIDMLEEQMARNHGLFLSRGVSITLDCDEDLNGYYDVELVGGVIHNILVNCARYSKREIRLAAFMRNGKLVLTVEDDGSGYPEDMLTGENARTHNAINFDTGSTNLGLYFAEEVAKMHRTDGEIGGIRLYNGGALGGGVFEMELP